MANDLTFIKENAHESFHETLAKASVSATRACRIITTDKPNLNLGMTFGTGLYSAAGTGDLASTDFKSGKNLLASINYEKKERIRWQDYEDNPELVVQRAAILANRGAATLRNAVETGITGLFTLAHPLAGGPLGVLAGTFFVDATIEYNAAASTQSNLLAAAALTQSTFGNARQVLAKYYGQDGVQLGMGDRVKLIVGPDHQDVAAELVKSAVSSAANQTNIAKDHIAEAIVLPGLSTKWFVVDEENNPLVLHIRKMPEISVSQTTDGTWIELVGRFTARFGVMPSEAGIVGSNF